MRVIVFDDDGREVFVFNGSSGGYYREEGYLMQAKVITLLTEALRIVLGLRRDQ